MKSLLAIIRLCLFCIVVAKWFKMAKAGVLLRYRGEVGPFYMRLRSANNSRNVRDPFNNYNRIERKYLCNFILRANNYICSSDDSFPQDRDNFLDSDLTPTNYQVEGYNARVHEELLKYNEKSMRIADSDSESINVKMFPCFKNDDMELYLTHGFIRNYMFTVVKTPDNYTGTRLPAPVSLQIWALFEPSPIFHAASNAMINHFWNYVEQGQLASSSFLQRAAEDAPLMVPWETEVNAFSALQHFRLCVTISDVLGSKPEFQLHIGKENIIYPIEGIANQQKVIMKDDGGQLARANVLPCAVNRHWTSPQFYVLRDPRHSATILVFRPVEHSTEGEVLKLEGKVVQVLALYDV